MEEVLVIDSLKAKQSPSDVEVCAPKLFNIKKHIGTPDFHANKSSTIHFSGHT